MTEYCTPCYLELCFMCDTPTEEEECCCGGTFGRVLAEQKQKKELPDYSKMPKRMVPRNHRSETVDRLNGKPEESDPDRMLNPVAVGRERALAVAPIPEGYECEWTLLEFAGGGIVPIIGCSGNMASDRHHGPDKSTLNNGVSVNLHRICSLCHSHWHALNDQYYATRPANNAVGYLPLSEYGECKEHDPYTRADPRTLIKDHTWWSKSTRDRPAYRSWGVSTGVGSGEL